MRLRHDALAVMLFAVFLCAQAAAPASAPAAVSGGGATPLPPRLQEELLELRQAGLTDDYAYRQVAFLTENIGPRLAGSPQAQRAVEYVAQELTRLGLRVRLEPAMVSHFVRGVETGELIEYPGQAAGSAQKIVLTALSGSGATPAAGITGDLLVVSSFDELASLDPKQVAGKIVLYNVAFDRRKAAAGFALDAYGEAVPYRADGAARAAQLGAVSSLIRSVGGAQYRLPHTGWSSPAHIPAAAVTAEDADLMAHLASQGRVRMHLTLTPQRLPDVQSYNVVADLPGSEHPEQVVVVSGHLDSWDLGTGAVDDAAGVAVAMGAAHLMQKLGLRPMRTLRVIAWMDEENGGGGRAAYTKAHSTEFANHVGVIESDLGASHPLGLAAKITPAAVEQLTPVLAILQGFGASLLRVTPFSPGSDIEDMAKAGVPSFGILQDGRVYFDYHHSPADTLDKIAPEELRENAAALSILAYALTNMPQPLSR